MKAVWNGVVLAESDDIVVLEGNPYFPPEALNLDLFRESSHRSNDTAMGEANYFDVVAGGAINADAAWTYHEPGADAAQIRDRVAFGKGVQVVD